MTARKNNLKSARLAAMHESAAALHCVGAVGDMTMQHFDALCLDPVVDLNSGLYIRRNRNLASEERSRLTRETMVDVDAGHTVSHQSVQAWVDSLEVDNPLSVPSY